MVFSASLWLFWTSILTIMVTCHWTCSLFILFCWRGVKTAKSTADAGSQELNEHQHSSPSTCCQILPNAAQHAACVTARQTADLTVQPAFTRMPKVFFAKPLLQCVPSLDWCMGLFHVRHRISICHHWTWWGSCQHIYPDCWDPSEWQPCSTWTNSLNVMSLTNLLRVHIIPLFWSLVKIFISVYPALLPGEHAINQPPVVFGIVDHFALAS